MLDEIRAALEDPSLPDDPFVRLDSIEFQGSDAALHLSMLDHGGEETWRRWVVRASMLLDYTIHEPQGDLALHGEEHVLARLHSDPRQALTFRGVPTSVPEVVGDLVRAHLEQVADWIPFPEFLNPCLDVDQLLGGGYGELASGPSFLMDTYAAVLDRHRMRPKLSAKQPRKRWTGGEWVEGPPSPVVLEIGASFFVAKNFEEVR